MEYSEIPINQILCGDCLGVMQTLPKESIDLTMFSPPYWGLRNYGVEGQIGLEPTYQEYVTKMVEVCREVKRVLKKTGSLYLVIGDTYTSGGGPTRHWGYSDPKYPKGRTVNYIEPQSFKQPPYQPKCLMGIPWRVALSLIDDGWTLRNDIIWHKPNNMPSSVKDRLTQTYEHIFHLVKSRKYYYDLDAIREPHTSIKDLGRKRTDQTHSKYFGIRPSGYLVQHPSGKNPGDILKLDSVACPSGPQRWEREGTNRVEARFNLKGKNPGDVLTYNSKYEKNDYGQTLQGFIRNQTIVKGRQQSRIDAKRLFPDDPEKQQEYINYIHDHKGHSLGKNPGDVLKITGRKPYAVQERTKPFVEVRNLPDLEELADYLNYWRKYRGLTIEEVELKLDSQAPHHWFNVESYPTVEDFLRIKDLLHFDNRFDEQMTNTSLKPSEKINHPLGKNPGDFYSINTKPFKGAHFAVYPEEICVRPIKSSCPPNGIVLDPMCGVGTTLVVAEKLGRKWIGIDLNPNYVEMARNRIASMISMY